MTSFSELKRNSDKSAERLAKELQKLNTNRPAVDDRLWTCQTDKAGNGYAVIRFLPAPPGEDVPFVRLFTHAFKGPGGWYIENSLTTIGQRDPVAEMNAELWSQGDGSPGRKRVTGSRDNPGTKRQLNYFSNIYVIKDPANPENEGKVFLFRYGKRIFDKINNLANPTPLPGEEALPKIDAFNLWKGANFKLRIRRVEGYTNFDASTFDSPSPLFDDDEKLEKIWRSEYSLQALIAPEQFKSYEELANKLARVEGHAPVAGRRVQQIPAHNVVENEDSLPWEPAPEPRSAPPASYHSAVVDDDDDDFAMFKRLAEED